MTYALGDVIARIGDGSGGGGVRRIVHEFGPTPIPEDGTPLEVQVEANLTDILVVSLEWDGPQSGAPAIAVTAGGEFGVGVALSMDGVQLIPTDVVGVVTDASHKNVEIRSIVGGGYSAIRMTVLAIPAIPFPEDFVLRVGVESGVAYVPLREWAWSTGKLHNEISAVTVPVEVVGERLTYLFSDCSSLTSVPVLDTSSVTNMDYMFYNCQALVSVPVLDTSSVTNMDHMFSDCSSLTSVPVLDTSSVTNTQFMFRDCQALVSVPALDTSQVTNMSGMFSGCLSLESVTLPGMGNGFTTAQTLDMRATKLNADAANALMQSLGTPPPGGILQLPATSAGADRSIATAKNWTVTFG